MPLLGCDIVQFFVIVFKCDCELRSLEAVLPKINPFSIRNKTIICSEEEFTASPDYAKQYPTVCDSVI